jgi:hypothetical protein
MEASSHADDTRKVEYAQLVLSVITEDISRVHVRITAALALAAVFVTQLPLNDLQGLEFGFRVVALAGIVLLALAAFFLLLYTQKLNQARIKIAAGYLREPLETVADPWSTKFSKKGSQSYIKLYTFGHVLFSLGGLAMALVIWRLLFP